MSETDVNSTQYTGIYKCPDNIKNFKLRVRIREITDSEGQINGNWEVKTLNWQEKIFNNFERQFYINENNCRTETEKYYNSILSTENDDINCDKLIFTYLECDDFDCDRISGSGGNGENKENFLDEIIEQPEGFDFKYFLQKSMENVELSENHSTMYIMADFGEYVHENWIKSEHILCILKFNEQNRVLKIYPDFSNDFPYTLHVNEGKTTRTFHYFIENACEDIFEELEKKEKEINVKINGYKKLMRNIALSVDFALPPKNKLETHVFYEIVSANGFENDEIFVRYHIVLPQSDRMSCKNPDILEGITQTCKLNDLSDFFFGHSFDLILEYDIQTAKTLPKFPRIYFEIISKGSWERFRCEGLTHHVIPLGKPGRYEFELSTFRLSGDSNISADLRRFFIGDCTNYNDISWIGVPRNFEDIVLNKYGVNTISTGVLKVRMHVLHQSQAFLEEFKNNDCNDDYAAFKNREKFVFEKLNSSTLVKSVHEVLEAFRKARLNMIKARDNTNE